MGKQVRAVNRRRRSDLPANVESVAGDITDHAQARTVCAGATTLYVAAGAPYSAKVWQEQLPRMMSGAIEAAATTGAKLVYVDNVYAYGKVDGPMTEALPYAPSSKKGAVRAQVAEMLLGAYARGKVRATIGRASDFFGPHALDSVLGANFFRAVLAGKPGRWLGNPDLPHSLTFLPDLGRGLVTLGTREEALGQIWHIPCAEPLTGRQTLELVFAALNQPVRISLVSRPMMRLGALFVPLVREALEMFYQYEAPHILDGSKFVGTFGYSPATPHAEAISQTVAWYRENSAS